MSTTAVASQSSTRPPRTTERRENHVVHFFIFLLWMYMRILSRIQGQCNRAVDAKQLAMEQGKHPERSHDQTPTRPATRCLPHANRPRQIFYSM